MNPRPERSLVLAAALAACGAPEATEDLPALGPVPEGAEAVSLLSGRPLVPPEPPEDVLARRTAEMEAAREAFERDPSDPDALIWYGRRLAYLGRYRDAIAVFTEGVERHPDDPRMLRHRGHRFITVRRFDLAERDLARAADMIRGTPDEVEPDGQPNARGIPISSLHSNVYYHLGLARYLLGDFEGALDAYRECMRVADNPDRLCSTSYWMYLTLMRLGRAREAAALLPPIRPDLDIVENHAYHRLLLLFRGDLDIDALEAEGPGDVQSATLAYGVANERYFRGESARALEILRALEESDQWAAFGAIAAEVDLRDPSRFAAVP